MTNIHHALYFIMQYNGSLNLTFKEDICATLCQLLVADSRAGLSYSQQSYNIYVIYMWNKCAHRRRYKGGSGSSTAVEVAKWYKEHIGCMISFRRISFCDQYLLGALTLVICSWLTFGRKANLKLSRSKPITWSLKEDWDILSSYSNW